MDELVFSSDQIRLMLLPEVGARLHRLQAFGHDLLRTPSDPNTHYREPFFWGGYVMAPWCNRIEADATRVGEQVVTVGSNFPDGSVIHGQVYQRPWQVSADERLTVEAGGDGWPWTYQVDLVVEVRELIVEIEMILTNTSVDPMPAGIGLHPWFVKPVKVSIPARSYFSPNNDIPSEPQPVTAEYDLRELQQMADDLDATWSDLCDPVVHLSWPTFGVSAAMRTNASCIVAASPGYIDAIALEPQTHAPQGLRRFLKNEPGGLTLLEPGAELALKIELSFS